MADAYLSSREINGKTLPRICMVCGRKAKLRHITLTQEVNPLLSIFTRVSKYRMCKAWVPLCDSHQGYFGGLSLFGIAVLLILLLMIGSIALGATVFEMRHPLFFIGNFCVFVTIAACASFGHLFYRMSRVRPTEISKAGVQLANVSPKFAEALADDEERD